MGANCCKVARKDSSSSTAELDPNLGYETDLEAYDAASAEDPKLRSFGSACQDRTSKVINKLATGIEVHAVTIDSLREVTDILLEMNQDVVKVILESKKDVWKNEDVFHLIEEYFENTLQTLEFCKFLKNCVEQTRRSHLSVLVAVERFGEGTRGDEDGSRYERMLLELDIFRASGNPFKEGFSTMFRNMYGQQTSMLNTLHSVKKKLDKRLKKLKIWRRVSNMIFVAAMVAVLICSVVAAAITAPPVVSAVAAATAVPIGSVGTWFKNMWKGYESAVKGQREIVSSTQIATYLSIKDMDTIRVLVNRLQVELESLSQRTDLSAGEEETAKLVIKEIKGTLTLFVKTIDDLSAQADRCYNDIKTARTAVLQRIVKPLAG